MKTDSKHLPHGSLGDAIEDQRVDVVLVDEVAEPRQEAQPGIHRHPLHTPAVGGEPVAGGTNIAGRVGAARLGGGAFGEESETGR